MRSCTSQPSCSHYGNPIYSTNHYHYRNSSTAVITDGRFLLRAPCSQQVEEPDSLIITVLQSRAGDTIGVKGLNKVLSGYDQRHPTGSAVTHRRCFVRSIRCATLRRERHPTRLCNKPSADVSRLVRSLPPPTEVSRPRINLAFCFFLEDM